MNYQLIFTTESQDDLKEGFFWYEEHRIGLGFDFMLTIEATLHSIERNPLGRPLIQSKVPNIRRAISPKFGFLIFYTVVQQSAIILAIVSSKRDPAIWKSRIGEI
jgi:toxin ParE1/3/4